MTFVTVLLSLLGLYVAVGIFFAIPFVLRGVNRLDPHAANGTWGFRMLIIPGTVFLWPLLLRRWMSGERQPPTERNAHRCDVGRFNVQTQIP
jgi:hypothetical protein